MSGARLTEYKDVCRAANAKAHELARELLPNGRISGDRRHWETDNLDDHPRPDGSYSLKLDLTGHHQGKWQDFATGEGGDMLDLVAIRLFGGRAIGKRDAFFWLRSRCGLDNADPARFARVRYQAQRAAATGAAEAEAERKAEAKKRGAVARWMSGVPIEGTPAARYLEARGIHGIPDPETGELRWPGSLRFHEEIWHTDAKLRLPAMLGTMVSPEGAQGACHTTWLGREPDTRRWVKAEADPATAVPVRSSKKVLGRSSGLFVPICKGRSGVSLGQLKPDADETIYVTEGIEDAIVVAMAMRGAVRTIAAYSVDNIGRIKFPPAIARLVVVIDRDKPKVDRFGKVVTPALDTLERSIGRQQARGVTVQLVVPPEPFKDVNDWLLSSPQSDSFGRREAA